MTESTSTSPEMIAFGLVAQAGDARSKAYEALFTAKQGDFEQAHELMRQAEESILEAHQIQISLLSKEASGCHQELSILLVHAQDHLMTAILAKELIAELIELHQTIRNNGQRHVAI